MKAVGVDMDLIKRIWNGEIPLVRVYWIYGVGIGLLWAILLAFSQNSITAICFVMFFYVPYQLVINVGIWRSASAYSKRKLWATLAKIASVLGIVLLITSIISVFINPTTTFQTFNKTEKKVKLGTNWDWRMITNHWWIMNEELKKNKYGMVNVWLKVEAMPKAKELGTDYSHSIVNVIFSCTDATYRVVGFTDIFTQEYLEDKEDYGRLDSAFVAIEENGKGLATAYHYVCNR